MAMRQAVPRRGRRRDPVSERFLWRDCVQNLELDLLKFEKFLYEIGFEAPRCLDISSFHIGQIKRRTRNHSGHRWAPTKTRDEEERITLVKSRHRRALDLISVFLSSLSSPDLSQRLSGYRNKTIWCQGGDDWKGSNLWFDGAVLVLIHIIPGCTMSSRSVWTCALWNSWSAKGSGALRRVSCEKWVWVVQIWSKLFLVLFASVFPSCGSQAFRHVRISWGAGTGWMLADALDSQHPTWLLLVSSSLTSPCSLNAPRNF